MKVQTGPTDYKDLRGNHAPTYKHRLCNLHFHHGKVTPFLMVFSVLCFHFEDLVLVTPKENALSRLNNKQ